VTERVVHSHDGTLTVADQNVWPFSDIELSSVIPLILRLP